MDAVGSQRSHAADAPDGVLITRPRDAAKTTEAAIRALGLRPVLAPVLRIVAVNATLPDPVALQAVLVTSANALPQLGAFRALRLLTVGDATADAARQAGFRTVESAGGDAVALAALATARLDPASGPVLLASGAGQGDSLAAALRPHFAIQHHAVYAAEPVRRLPVAARAALARGALRTALFFSAETARIFVALAQRAGVRDTTAPVEALAISARAELALTPLPWRRIRVAGSPDQDALLALLR